MRALIPTASRFVVTPDGNLWTPHTYRSHAFWKRYLDVYDELVLMAPTEPRPVAPDNWHLANGPGIRAVVRPADAARGIVSSARLALDWRLRRRELFGLHLRLPSLAGAAVAAAGIGERPFGAELVSDPFLALARGVFESRLRVVAQLGMTASVRHLCRRATSVAYTTAGALQEKYPPSPRAFVTHYSSLDLTPDHFRPPAAITTRAEGPFTIGHVGSMAVLDKGHSSLLRAFAECLASGCDARLRLVGDGKYAPRFREQAERLGITKAVTFLGRLPRDEQVRAQLDEVDLFVLPAEDGGLPRALLEAMARGRACIAYRVGGAPELLTPEALVPARDSKALAAGIARALSDPDWRHRVAHLNRKKAEEYRYELLRQRRIAFYESVKSATQAWFRAR